jgi:hypothetical protein
MTTRLGLELAGVVVSKGTTKPDKIGERLITFLEKIQKETAITKRVSVLKKDFYSAKPDLKMVIIQAIVSLMNEVAPFGSTFIVEGNKYWFKPSD